jgi:uncharacterized protein HemX
MNETIDSSADKISPGDETDDRGQIEVANAMWSWKENLKDNLSIVVLVSVAIGLLVGYYIWQQQEEKRREQWAEVLFRQVKNWLTERARENTGSVEEGLEYVRSAAEQAADKGAEHSRRLNPFRRVVRRRFLGSSNFKEPIYGTNAFYFALFR